MATPPPALVMIENKISELGDWRGEILAQLRASIRTAIPGVVEELKWRGVPTWSHHGIICTGEIYKDKVKTTFAKGALLADPTGLFNSSLTGNTRRAIDIDQAATIDWRAFEALVVAAAQLNVKR